MLLRKWSNPKLAFGRRWWSCLSLDRPSLCELWWSSTQRWQQGLSKLVKILEWLNRTKLGSPISTKAWFKMWKTYHLGSQQSPKKTVARIEWFETITSKIISKLIILSSEVPFASSRYFKTLECNMEQKYMACTIQTTPIQKTLNFSKTINFTLSFLSSPKSHFVRIPKLTFLKQEGT